MQEMWVPSQGQEDPLEKEMATHSSILAWEIPQRSLASYSSWGHKESEKTEQLSTHSSVEALSWEDTRAQCGGAGVKEKSLTLCQGQSCCRG